MKPINQFLSIQGFICPRIPANSFPNGNIDLSKTVNFRYFSEMFTQREPLRAIPIQVSFTFTRRKNIYLILFATLERLPLEIIYKDSKARFSQIILC